MATIARTFQSGISLELKVARYGSQRFKSVYKHGLRICATQILLSRRQDVRNFTTSCASLAATKEVRLTSET